jgi:hypothetical protein
VFTSGEVDFLELKRSFSGLGVFDGSNVLEIDDILVIIWFTFFVGHLPFILLIVASFSCSWWKWMASSMSLCQVRGILWIYFVAWGFERDFPARIFAYILYFLSRMQIPRYYEKAAQSAETEARWWQTDY